MSKLEKKQLKDLAVASWKAFKLLTLASALTGFVCGTEYLIKNPGKISILTKHKFSNSFDYELGRSPTVKSIEVQENKDLEYLLLDGAQRRDLPADLILGMAKVESKLDASNEAIRLEPQHVAKHGIDGARSYGSMQVMGFNAAYCGMSWKDLIGKENIKNNVNCAFDLIGDCLARSKAKDRLTKYREALGCYNTGKLNPKTPYASNVLAAIGEKHLS